VKGYSVFIAGIIQGSIPDGAVHSQDYRRELKEILEAHMPGARVYCPIENHPDSLAYDDDKARRVFFDHIEMVAASDCLITFLPEASMGTAVEMYAAREAAVPVITISPLSGNWAVKFLSDVILADTGEFRAYAASGALLKFLDKWHERQRP
jgi:hypothetical protein